MASAPPPAGANPAGRTLTIQFESGRRMAPDALRINPHGATLEVDGFFHTPLKLTLGQLHLGMVDRGARATLQRRLDDLNQHLATLPQQTTDLTELRTRRAQLTAEITKLEKALEEVQAA